MKTNAYKRTSHRGGISFMFVFMTLCLAVGILSLHFDSVYAGDTVIAKVKVTSRGLDGHSLPAPDEEGHVVGIGRREGEVDFDGKESARYECTTMVDGWRGKKGIYKGYTKFTFKDGSAIVFSWTAEGVPNKEGLPMQQGTGIIQQGTGRFEGIRGQTAFTTIQLKPTAEDPTRASVSDAVIVYTLP